MKVLTAFLLLLSLTFSHGFYRLGTVDNANVRGTLYLIDRNTLFLFEFSAPEAINIRGTDGASNVLATTGSAISNVNMEIDATNGVLINSDYITIEIASNNQHIISFPVQTNLYIPCTAEYLGRFMKSGGTSHDLDGHVFVDRSARRYFVAGLDLDGNAPAAYFWLHTGTTPTSQGVRAGYNGVYNVRVDDVMNVDANVTVPPGQSAVVFQSLSVWCESAVVSFGHVVIPTASADSFTCATKFGPVTLEKSPRKHDVTAEVYVLGPTTIGFKDFTFDGDAPATWYWGAASSNLPGGFIIPDQTGSLAKLGRLTNVNVAITLPAGYDVCNAPYISVYCRQASVSFGDLSFVNSYGCSNCPATCKTNSSVNTGFSCRDLSTTIKTRVEYRYDSINSIMTYRLLTCGQEVNQYVAFGISGSNLGVSMAPGGDPVVCRYDANGVPECIDYGLTIRSQCTVRLGVGSGACPDTVLTNGVNNYVNTQLERVGSRTVFTTMRAINTSDPNDQVITPGTPQFIIWARGNTFDAINNQRWVLRHAPTDRANVNNPIQIDFSAAAQCTGDFVCDTTPPVTVTPWTVPPLCVDADNNVVEAVIGNTGGSQGYKGITGEQGWGIAWYLNGRLIPEIYVLRGTTVKFTVNGGDDPSDSAIYHPFYITNSSGGGILGVVGANQPITETIYAGLTVSGNIVSNLTVGKYCIWDEPQGMSGDDYPTFSAYRDALTLSCGTNLAPQGEFEWTTDTNTPNLLYYQCASHRLLGWKIRVVDDLAMCLSLQSGAVLALPLALLLFVSVLLTMFYAF